MRYAEVKVDTRLRKNAKSRSNLEEDRAGTTTKKTLL